MTHDPGVERLARLEAAWQEWTRGGSGTGLITFKAPIVEGLDPHRFQGPQQ